MTDISAFLMVHGGGGPVTRNEIILLSLAVGTILLISFAQAYIKSWIERRQGRDWPTASALIDIVSVADVTDDPRLPSYLATLTYAYNNPDQQLGEYSRRFGNKTDAEAWANSYKGETVRIHVDPRDPASSVLREEDL